MEEEKKKVILKKYEKPNRVRLSEISQYDLLMKINNNIGMKGGDRCVIAYITGHSRRCHYDDTGINCAECIQRWLNDHDWK